MKKKRAFFVLGLCLCVSSIHGRSVQTDKAPPTAALVHVNFIYNDGSAGHISVPDVSLLQIIEDGLVDFYGSARSFDIQRSERARSDHHSKIRVTTGGRVLEISGTHLRVQNDGAPVEMVLRGIPKDAPHKMVNVWRGIKRFRWEYGGLVAWHSTKENVLYELENQTLRKHVVHRSSAAGMNCEWIFQYLGVTPAMLEATLREQNPRADDQLSEFGSDLYLPRHDGRVEILKAQGRNIVPEIWKRWKVQITWKCPRPKPGI